MDAPVEYQKSANSEIPIQNNKTKKLLFEILIVIISLILLLAALNYFNILSISKFLPGQKSQPLSLQFQPTSTVEKNKFPSSSLKISCPSIKELCQAGTGVIKDEKYVGWGFVLASGSAIFAAFDGNAESTQSTYTETSQVTNETKEKKFIRIILDNKGLGLKATYLFRGNAIKSKEVSKGELIGVSNGKIISIYDNKSLIFSLITGYPTTNNIVILNKGHFE
ncbi:MAG: hypothetical protein A3D74_05815 [Candidatus Levybacteria bacterium RIFCSPHIGHO2_02_FULL_37_13]|nr:MAG: hypothetical protein A3D74_05815 [Candidatus Levybacteria bacterium RIFCSPHIGHO2_02_FULL_37_13]OGH30547.1 MAG: hypothetical protein A3E40_03290 [Candidatus Levybacteria bacterium RIFCSPHIGHO2_12_FULL_37_9]OGH39591.1 MAG: hypothetical protein A3B41_03745 [Candidatus Levybacteria bacterium RIFCSPLOWO2_01_FULL_37_26]